MNGQRYHSNRSSYPFQKISIHLNSLSYLFKKIGIRSNGSSYPFKEICQPFEQFEPYVQVSRSNGLSYPFKKIVRLWNGLVYFSYLNTINILLTTYLYSTYKGAPLGFKAQFYIIEYLQDLPVHGDV